MKSLSTYAKTLLAGRGESFVFHRNDITINAEEKKLSTPGNEFIKTSVGDFIHVFGTGVADGVTTVHAVGPAGAYVIVNEPIIGLDAGVTVSIASITRSSSFKDVFKNFVIKLFSGPQPASADDAEDTSALLVTLTRNSLPVTPGLPANCLNFADSVDGVLSIPSGHVWSGIPIASGIANYARFYDNRMVTGASTTEVRMDLACGVGTKEFRMATTNLVANREISVSFGSIKVL